MQPKKRLTLVIVTASIFLNKGDKRRRRCQSEEIEVNLDLKDGVLKKGGKP